MASVTVVASGAWTDFAAFAEKNFTLSQLVPVGDRAVFIHSSTIDNGSNPNTAGYGGINDPLFDTSGNTWTRDAASPVDATNIGTTTEVFSTFVGPTSGLPTAGFGLNVHPDSRGLSAQWVLLDVAGLAENNGAPSFDTASSQIMNAVTAWSTPSISLATSDEIVIAVYGDELGTIPSVPWVTDTAGWTSAYQQYNAGPGSSVGIAVFTKEVVSGSAQHTGTTAAARSGTGVIVAYKVGAAAPVAYPDPVFVQSGSAQTAAGTSQAVTLSAATKEGSALLVTATVWKSGGADPGGAVSDNNGNAFVSAQATAAATGAGARVYTWVTSNKAPKSGHQFTVTANATAEISLEVTEWTGVDGRGFAAASKGGPTTSVTVTGGALTIPPGGLFYQTSTEDAGTTFINAQGWSKTTDIAINQDIHTQWSNSATGSQNPAQTLAVSGSWAALNVVLNPLPNIAFAPRRMPLGS